MLSLIDVTCSARRSEGDGEEEIPLLEGITAAIPENHLMAVVGPSGCGKTTLLKLIAGLQEESGGRILWNGEDLADRGGLLPQELGYVPQFSIAHEFLTVTECVGNAVRLRVATGRGGREDVVRRVMAETGMTPFQDRRVAVLSGGQKRRLALAMELVTTPALLLCDEVTTGLDPQSEAEIVRLLRSLSRERRCSVVHVTHSLTHLDECGSVLVLYQGRIAYHGPPQHLLHYFSIDRVEDVYRVLSERAGTEWHASWIKRRDAYYDSMGILRAGTAVPPGGEEAGAGAGEGNPEPRTEGPGRDAPDRNCTESPDADRLPGFLQQFAVLFARRWLLFLRDRVHLLLHLALIAGFPLLVAIFVWDGIGPMPSRQGADLQSWDLLRAEARIAAEQSRLGVLISGLVMFQVVLLALQGAGNGSREIAAERLLYEKERLSGLRPAAYLLSKVAFLAVLVSLQSIWMGLFVEHFAGFPGRFADRLPVLLLVNGAMTAVCLAISSLLRSAEQASLLGIYLVGFQVPLSGAVLALPEAAEKFVRPLIAARWGWSGQLSTMRSSDYYVAIAQAVPTGIVGDSRTALLILSAHVAAGIAVAWAGCARRRWD